MFQFLVETVAILLCEGLKKKKKKRILFYCHFIFLIALAQPFPSENHCKCCKKLKWPTLFTYTHLFFCCTYFVLLHNKIKICFIHNIPVLQIRAGQQSITANLWPLTTHIYHVMIIVANGFSKKSFYYHCFYSV